MARRTAVLFCFLVLAVATHSAAGQDARYSLLLRGTPLHHALEELVRLTEIDLIYSSDLVADRVVFCDGRAMTAENLLRCLLQDSGLDYVRSSSGTYVLIDSLRARPYVGVVAGRIVDQTTGEPLPSANILLADASTGTVSNEAGLFTFSAVISGTHRVIVTYLGYESAADTIEVRPDQESVLEIGLMPATFEMDPIVVDGITQRLPSRDLGRPSLDGAAIDLSVNVGTPDVARSTTSLPGVSTRHPLADLHIQGSDAGEHLTVLDGVPVRDPVTLGRHLGAFSPLAINRITVHKAGFGAALGSHLSGVVDLTHDISAGDAPSASVILDPISFSGKMQGRVPLFDRRYISTMVSLRNSVWGIFQDPGLRTLLDRWNTVDPVLAGLWIRQPVTETTLTWRRHQPDLSFSDLHAAARADVNSFHSIDGSFYRATNRISSELAALNVVPSSASDRLMLTRDDYDWTNWTGQVRSMWLTSSRMAATLQFSAGSHASEYRYLSARQDVPVGSTEDEMLTYVSDLGTTLDSFVGSYEVNQIREMAALGTVNRSFAPDRHVELSVKATYVDSWFELGNQFIAPFTHGSDAFEMASHVEGSFALGIRTTLEPGLRVTYLPTRRTLYAEPRLALRHDVGTGRAGPMAFRVSGGLYRQFIPSFTLTSSGSTSVVPFMRFWLPVGETLAPPRALHLAGESLWMPHEDWTVSLEAYHKWQPRLLTIDYQKLLEQYPNMRPRPDPMSLAQSDFVGVADGRAYGAALRIRFEQRRLAGSLQYAYSFAERTFPSRFNDRPQPTPWNDPHRLAASARLDVGRGLALHAEAEAAWHRRWALRRSYYDYLALSGGDVSYAPYNLERPDRAKAPMYSSIDVGASYELDLRPVQIRMRAALVNILDRNNVYDHSLNPVSDTFESIDRALPGRRPVFSVRLYY